jgi:DNA-binding NarL/FixJ family response regulator
MRVVALVSDLMDRSRVSAAVPDVAFTTDPAACVDADVVVIDLGRHSESVAAVRAVTPSARIVAFGPHVDDELLAGAQASGADVVLARSRFFRDPAAALRSAT